MNGTVLTTWSLGLAFSGRKARRASASCGWIGGESGAQPLGGGPFPSRLTNQPVNKLTGRPTPRPAPGGA